MEIESNRGVTIDYIDYLAFGGKIPTDRQPHTGVFSACVGDIDDLQYGDMAFTTRNIEDLILNEYQYRDILFAPKQFVAELGNVWNRYFIPFYQNLKNAQEFAVTDESEKVNETITASAQGQGTASGNTKYSDTPNQYLTDPNSFNGLTSYSDSTSTDTTSNSGKSERTLETQKSHNQFERWLEIAGKNRNIIYEFVDRFRVLFQTTYIFNGR